MKVAGIGFRSTATAADLQAALALTGAQASGSAARPRRRICRRRWR